MKLLSIVAALLGTSSALKLNAACYGGADNCYTGYSCSGVLTLGGNGAATTERRVCVLPTDALCTGSFTGTWTDPTVATGDAIYSYNNAGGYSAPNNVPCVAGNVAPTRLVPLLPELMKEEQFFKGIILGL